MRYQVRYAFHDDGSEYTAVINDLSWQDKQDRFELLAELRHPTQWAKRYNLDYVVFEEAVE
jgi:hypothetical protein